MVVEVSSETMGDRKDRRTSYETSQTASHPTYSPGQLVRVDLPNADVHHLRRCGVSDAMGDFSIHGTKQFVSASSAVPPPQQHALAGI